MLLLPLLAACHDPPASPARQIDAVVQSEAPARERYELCEAMDDPALRDDCTAIVAADEARRGPPDCSAIPAGRTRQDCWFSTAEREARIADPARLWYLCEQAGTFAAECVQHVGAMQLEHRLDGAFDPEADWPVVQVLGREWVDATHRADMASTVERLYWNRHHELHLPYDPAVCEGLAEEDRPPCRQGLADALRKAWREALQRDRATLCGVRADAASNRTLARLGASPDVSLDMDIGVSSGTPLLLRDLLLAEWGEACVGPPPYQ